LATNIIVDPEQLAAEEAAAHEAADKAEASGGNSDQTQAEDDLPEKYRGKSLREIVDMHRNAESELGRKNNEIGLVRKLADELIGVRAIERQAQENPESKPKPLTADTLLNDPDEAILGVVRRESLSRTESLEQKLQSIEGELMVEKFEKKHPGFQATMATQEFGTFVQGSQYRKNLAIKAAQGDFTAADELFGLYEDVKSTKGTTTTQQNDEGVSAARKASLARSGGSSASGVVPSGDGKKILSRTELMEMRIKRPDEFDARQDEILQAYREKRVR